MTLLKQLLNVWCAMKADKGALQFVWIVAGILVATYIYRKTKKVSTL